MLNVTILVNILEIFIINKYSKLNEEPKYNKNIPEFIIKEFQNLFEISKLEELAKEIILDNMLKTLIYLIILDILLIKKLGIPPPLPSLFLLSFSSF